jgi:hypothetical protein
MIHNVTEFHYMSLLNYDARIPVYISGSFLSFNTILSLFTKEIEIPLSLQRSEININLPHCVIYIFAR